MDPITHGITGALLGKGFFHEALRPCRHFRRNCRCHVSGYRCRRANLFHDPLAIVKYHRGITHSFVGLRFSRRFLRGSLALASRRLKRNSPSLHDVESPSWTVYSDLWRRHLQPHSSRRHDVVRHAHVDATFAAARRLGFALHHRFHFHLYRLASSNRRVDLFRSAAKSSPAPSAMWVLFTLCAFIVWKIAAAVGFPFHLWIAVLASALIAALFFLPAVRGAGFGITTARWCQAGTFAMLAYLFACGVGPSRGDCLHVKNFASANNIRH